jgi:exopolysaccharide biosynthesis WecB/TagA/CpsF family protein
MKHSLNAYIQGNKNPTLPSLCGEGSGERSLRMKKSRILNIDILSVSKKQLLENLIQGVLFTPNVDHLMNLQKDKDFYQAYSQADFIVCDSQIVRFASWFLKQPIVETIAGSDFLSLFCFHHKNNPAIRVFLLGAREGVALQAMKNINEKTGSEIVTGAYSPSFGFEKNDAECEEIIRIINENQATVLVLGVGSPKQEKWIMKYKNRFSHIKIFMGLGATIDFEAGILKRCPRFLRKVGLEWMFRLWLEPKRLWYRYMINDMPFFWLILKEKIKQSKTRVSSMLGIIMIQLSIK